GSPECEVIWVVWVTPWGESLLKPRARVRRSTGIVFGLWPSATTPSGGQKNPEGTTITGKTPEGAKVTVTLQNVVLACWPANTSNAKTTEEYNEAGNSAGQVAQRKIIMGLWPQSSARDWKGGKASKATLSRNSRPCNELVFSTWPALRSTDGDKAGPNQSFGAGGSPLPSQVYQTAAGSSSNARTGNIVGSLHP